MVRNVLVNRALSLSMAGSLLAACLGAGAVHADEISPAELASRLSADNGPVILDVRTRGEYQAGHIPGAVNIPHNELQARMQEIIEYRDQELVVHCQTGPRGGFAQSILLEADFTRVRELDGHMRAWQARGYPLE